MSSYGAYKRVHFSDFKRKKKCAVNALKNSEIFF